MRTTTKTVSTLAAVALTLSVGSAQAALVNFTLTGDVVFAQPGNLFGLTNDGNPVTSIITVTGTFDDSVLTGGSGTIDFRTVPGNSFTLQAGSYTFQNTEDSSGVYPQLTLNAGAFDSLFFNFDVGDWGYFDSQFDNFIGDDDNFGTVSGYWGEFSMTAVPVPGAIWLLGSGLLGLAGIARRKTAA